MLARGLIQRRLRGVRACPAVLMCWRGEDRPWLEARTWLRSAPRQHIGEVPLTRTVESLASRSLTVSCWPNGTTARARRATRPVGRTTRHDEKIVARADPVAVTQDGRLTRSAARRRASAGIFYVFSTGSALLVLGFAGNLVLARLLSPRDFGLVALGVTVMTFRRRSPTVGSRPR